jgi:ferrochelatase
MKIFVILMTYGSPATIADVPEYLRNVYGGKEAPHETIVEFQRRYKVIGGSPLVQITQAQASVLEEELNKQKLAHTFKVMAGMRFSHPFIEEVITQNADDTDAIIGIIMSPQYSPIIMHGYPRELEAATAKLTRKPLVCKTATDWHLQPFFIQAMAEKVQLALDSSPPAIKKQTPVLFSAHSMPKRIIDKEPNYISDLKETAYEIAKIVGLSRKQWLFCYQSAGHTPEEWLKPDFADIMPELKAKGIKHVLIAPVQFLADHLEILYDVNIGAREQAEENGIQFAKTESLNTSPLFIKALVEIVKETLKENQYDKNTF